MGSWCFESAARSALAISVVQRISSCRPDCTQRAARVDGTLSLHTATGVTIDSWSDYFTSLRNFRNNDYSNSADNFIRAYGTGKLVLLFGSFFAVLQFFLGIGAGMKAGKAQKAARESTRKEDKQRKRRG